MGDGICFLSDRDAVCERIIVEIMNQTIITYTILALVAVIVVWRLYQRIAPKRGAVESPGCASGCGGCALKSECGSVKTDVLKKSKEKLG